MSNVLNVDCLYDTQMLSSCVIVVFFECFKCELHCLTEKNYRLHTN